MVMILIYLLIYIFILIFDLIPIKRKDYTLLFAFNLTTMIVSFLIVILVSQKLRVPSPSNFIEDIVRFFI